MPQGSVIGNHHEIELVRPEAIRYAVEEIPASSLLGAFLEVNEERFNSNEIRRLYESVEYPLPRQPAAIRDRLLSVRRAS